jgi:hypothetical protein
MRGIDLAFLAIIITVVIVYYMLKQGVEKPTPLRRKDVSALRYLEEKGYTHSRERTSTTIHMMIGDKAHKFTVSANFAVKKDGSRYLVFLRSSEDTERLNNAVLRNRLLLLSSLYGPKSILFVNPEADKIQEVTFTFNRQNPFLSGILIAMVITIIILVFMLLTVGGFI